MSTIGGQIRALRELRGWSQKELAAKLGMRYDVLSSYEVGKLNDPKVSTLRHFAEIMEVTIDYFASEESPQKFLRRGMNLDYADKMATLPIESEKHIKTQIQLEYDDVIKKQANEPYFKRKTRAVVV